MTDEVVRFTLLVVAAHQRRALGEAQRIVTTLVPDAHVNIAPPFGLQDESRWLVDVSVTLPHAPR